MNGIAMDNFQYNKAIAAYPKMTTLEKAIMWAIGNYYNWSTKSPAFPSIDQLAKDINCHPRTVTRAIRHLVDIGLLSCQRQFNKSNLYTPVFSALLEVALDTQGVAYDTPRGGIGVVLKDKEKIKEKINNRSSESKDSSDTNSLNLFDSEIVSDINNKSLDDWFSNYERTDARRSPAARSDKFPRGDYKYLRGNKPDNEELSRFNQEVAQIRAEEW